MNFKFSLRDLLTLIAVISVACAALSNTSIWWHSIVVTISLTGMTGLLVWGTLHSGSHRAFACGWLLFAVAYLVFVLGPWTGDNLGAHFITSKGLAHLEWKAWGDNHSPFVLSRGMNSYGDVDLNYTGLLNISSIWRSYPATSIWDGQGHNWADGLTTFQSTGHWLFASAFGYCGGHLAAFLFLRREAAKTQFKSE